jgi:hypothetical protein
MDHNGAEARTHLEARVRELELALALLARRWQDELAPRLLDVEQDVDRLLSYLEAGARRPDDGADTRT